MENKKPIDKQTSELGVSKNNLDIEHDCAICSKEFKLEESLRKHIKLFHYFPCRFCSKIFSEIRFLESHSSSTCIGYTKGAQPGVAQTAGAQTAAGAIIGECLSE